MKLREAIECLRRAGVDSPEHDARELFLYALGLKRSDIIPRDQDYSSELLEELIRRRAGREPLQYIIGEVGFFREEYTVCPDVLIPREDTEILVDFAVRNIPDGARFLDLCCGSGCIAVSTLNNTENTRALAVDISERAVEITRRNAEKNGVLHRLETAVCDLLTDGIPSFGEVYAVLSNPPYVTRAEYEELSPELYREPRLAFVGGEDGMVFYERLLPLSLEVISPGGFAAFEIGSGQGDAICALAEKYSLKAELIKDYSGHDRVAVIRKK